ncbi:MAG: hypothetical protein KDK36_01090 [Leptospiraceae bacterium]|nr:hypothetical protein [Leptospiraceae bacterium]
MKEKKYLPLMMDVTEKKILILGGGKASAEKLRTLSQLGKKVRVISPEFVEDFNGKDWLELVRREYQYGDLDEFDIIYCGINDQDLEKEIKREAVSKGKFINFIDKVEYSDFISVAGFIKDTFSIFISTYGKAPGGAKKIREIIEDKLDLEKLDKEISEYIVERERKKNEKLGAV